MAVVDGGKKRREPSSALRVHCGAGLEQQLRGLEMPALSGEEEGRLPSR